MQQSLNPVLKLLFGYSQNIYATIAAMSVFLRQVAAAGGPTVHSGVRLMVTFLLQWHE